MFLVKQMSEKLSWPAHTTCKNVDFDKNEKNEVLVPRNRAGTERNQKCQNIPVIRTALRGLGNLKVPSRIFSFELTTRSTVQASGGKHRRMKRESKPHRRTVLYCLLVGAVQNLRSKVNSLCSKLIAHPADVNRALETKTSRNPER